MSSPDYPDSALPPSRFRSVWRASGPMRGAVAAGAIGGLVVGGVGGRIVMRLVAIMDPSSDGARTDFGGTAGEITLGGTLNLVIITTIAGVAGGFAYMLLRRWILGSGARRGLLFGLGVALVPAIPIVNEDNPDLQIFEPVLVIVAMLWLLFLLYGLAVGWLADAFHPAPPASERRRTVMAVHGVLAAVVGLFLIVNVVNVMGIVDGAGTCLSANDNGGCAVPAASTEAP